MKLLAELAGDMDEREILDALNGDAVPVASKEEPEVYIADLTQELRMDVDDWIDSGRKPDGSESPHWRNYVPAKRAFEAAQIHIEHWAKLHLRPGKGEGPQLLLVPKYSASAEMIEVKERCGQIIVIILLSDLRDRIAKCRFRKCNRYFLLGRPRRKPYAHGLFCCPNHNRAESAMEHVARGRSEVKTFLIDSAARELARLSQDRRSAGLDPKGRETRVRRRLVDALNKRLQAKKSLWRMLGRVRVNWVTRHWTEIQKRGKEFSHV